MLTKASVTINNDGIRHDATSPSNDSEKGTADQTAPLDSIHLNYMKFNDGVFFHAISR